MARGTAVAWTRPLAVVFLCFHITAAALRQASGSLWSANQQPRRGLFSVNLVPSVKFGSNFGFWSFCDNTWSCRQSQDGSVTLNTNPNTRTAGFTSKNYYFYGVFSVEMKLPRVNTTGMYHTLYLFQQGFIPNDDPRHAEIDIEFYGSAKSKNIVIATNIIVGGWQMLEQHRLPFDPALAFHRYTIMWSPKFITWFVDDVPIRMTLRKDGMPWPSKPLHLKGSLWDASPASSRFPSPLVSLQYRDFKIASCSMPSPSPPFPPCVHSVANPNLPWNSRMTPQQKNSYVAYQRYIVNAWNWGRWNAKARLLRKGVWPH